MNFRASLFKLNIIVHETNISLLKLSDDAQIQTEHYMYILINVEQPAQKNKTQRIQPIEAAVIRDIFKCICLLKMEL